MVIAFGGVSLDSNVNRNRFPCPKLAIIPQNPSRSSQQLSLSVPGPWRWLGTRGSQHFESVRLIINDRKFSVRIIFFSHTKPIRRNNLLSYQPMLSYDATWNESCIRRRSAGACCDACFPIHCRCSLSLEVDRSRDNVAVLSSGWSPEQLRLSCCFPISTDSTAGQACKLLQPAPKHSTPNGGT